MVDSAGSAAAVSIAASASAISDRASPSARAFLYGAYAGYPYYYAGYDGCLAPRRIWTPYGWRIRWVNVCY